MVENLKDYVCIRDCYHENNLYKVGNPLLPGHLPNKHFLDTKGKPFKMPKEIKIIVAGDDPRSTVKIIADIEKKYGCDLDEDTGRKEAFALWMKLEAAGPVKPKKTPKVKPGAKPKKKVVQKSKTTEDSGEQLPEESGDDTVKPLSQWTPDEIDNVKLTDLGKIFNHPYKQGMSKEDFLDQILKLEAK